MELDNQHGARSLEWRKRAQPEVRALRNMREKEPRSAGETNAKVYIITSSSSGTRTARLAVERATLRRYRR